MPKIGVILSGCGVHDGSEIHESVLTLLALDRTGAEAVIAAPDKDLDVVDHRTGRPTGEKRNVLAEAARIARGKVVDLAKVSPDELDAVILPGGFGVTRNLSDFHDKGHACTIEPGTERLLRKMHQDGKPIAAFCVAPVVLARLFGKEKDRVPELTIGDDTETAKKLEKMGAKHFETETTDVLIDDRNRFVTTPCYMRAERIGDVARGAEKAVYAVLSMVAERSKART